MIQVELITLLAVMMPLLLAFFVGIWALLHRMVFKPLDGISKTLEKFRSTQGEEKTKVAVLETKVEKIEIEIQTT